MLVSDLPFLRDHWYPICRTEELGPEPRRVRLFGEDFVAWRGASGAPALVDPFCPHRSAHLGTGWVDGDLLVCPYHGWQYDDSGRCRFVPQLPPDVPIPSRARVDSYAVMDRYGVVWACVGSPVGEPPVWQEAEEGGWRLYVEFFEAWEVSAMRIIDNNLDQSHPAYVHMGTFGDPDQAADVPLVEVRAHGFVSRVDRDSPGVAAQVGEGTDESRRYRRLTEVELLAPLSTHTRFYFEDANDYAFFGHATPIDDEHSFYIRMTALAGSEEEQPYGPFTAFGERVKEEDRVILEATVADFPLDVTSEVHLKTDRGTLQYRRYLQAQLEASLAGGGTPVSEPGAVSR